MSRSAAALILLAACTVLSMQAVSAADGVIDTIAFGSCAKEDRPQPIWDQVIAQQPDLFLFIGDNMYADSPEKPRSPGDIAEAYRVLGQQPGYQRLLRTCPVLATWDDHDYGLNDAGKEFPMKRESQQLMLMFFNEPADSLRWQREGVYGAWVFGPPGRRVQVILLDTRYHRDALRRAENWQRGNIGPYLPHEDGSPQLLGEEQWSWLGEQLKKPADLRVIGSSIQVVPYEHQWECWGNFPHERRRLYDLIGETGAGGVVMVSGDRHLMEISRDEEEAAPYPMVDFTSSGLTQDPGEADEPNRFRVSPVLRQTNFGVLRIDWGAQPVLVTMVGIGSEGQRLMEYAVTLDELQTR
ncbi:MAG: alkaline phosphatase D family protein [Planctomycetota bacterium]